LRRPCPDPARHPRHAGRRADIEVVGEAGDYSELRGLLRQHSCDVLVLDINMPGRSGLDVLCSRTRATRCKVLVVSMYPEDQYALRP
jgi:DNA-binding NarL/FixJ family response regulator